MHGVNIVAQDLTSICKNESKCIKTAINSKNSYVWNTRIFQILNL